MPAWERYEECRWTHDDASTTVVRTRSLVFQCSARPEPGRSRSCSPHSSCFLTNSSMYPRSGLPVVGFNGIKQCARVRGQQLYCLAIPNTASSSETAFLRPPITICQ